jgi:Spy/CpxP family protein refolding chaperone
MTRTFLALLPLAAVLAAPLPAMAQDKGAPSAVPASMTSAEMRSRIQSDKKGIVQRNLPLTDAEAKKFWPLYDAYQKDLAAPQSRLNRAILDYVSAGSNLTDANAKRLTDDVLKAQETEAKLFSSHIAKVQKVLPGAKAARYLQLENKMRAVIHYEMALAIPLVP